jgi:hypothetical protein
MDAKGRTIAGRIILGLTVLSIAGWNLGLLHHPSVFRGVATNHATRSPRDPGVIGGNLPIAFEPNRGQTAAQVRFLGQASGYRLFIKDDESVIALNGVRSRRRKGHGPGSMLEEPRAIRIKLLDADPSQKIDARDPLPGRVNYLLGRDPAGWLGGIPTYRTVTQHGVWPGIDLVYYGDPERRIESDFVVAPGADPQSIRLEFTGGDDLTIDHDGNLHIAAGSRIVTMLKPRIYQGSGVHRRVIDGRYVIASANHPARGGQQVRFELAPYDSRQMLVIDPKLELVYSTYLGGSVFDEAYAIAVDDQSDAYVTGRTASLDFPATQGQLRDSEDAFVAKFSADGGSLIYATFIGGTGGVGFTEAYAIAVSGRNAYITGVADTSHFPTTEHAFQRDTPDGGGHPFVSELTRNGVSFVFSTYVASAARQKCSRGDVGVDWGTGIDVAVGTSEVWVTGITCSEHFPVAFQFQSSDEVSYPAGFLFELSPGGRQLLLSTYLGALDGFTQSNAIALNHHLLVESPGIWVTGTTDARSFPTKNAFQPHRHGFSDAFVMKFRLPGRFASLAYSTFLGGDNGDEGRSIKVDGAGHAYVIGNFASLNFPITQVPSSTSYSVPGVFIAKFSQDGSSLLYCDALGNGFDQSGDSIDLFDGFAYVTGFTDSRDFPVVDAFQDSAQGGRDAFVSKISKDGTSLIYSTYLGGSGDDQGRGIAVGPGGDAFVTGITKSGNFPTQHPFQSLPGGQASTNAFVTKLHLGLSTTVASTRTAAQ